MSFPFPDAESVFARFLFLARGWAPRLVVAGLALAPVSAFGSLDEAATLLTEKIDRAEKKRVELCKVLGAIYEEIGDTEKAIESYRKGFSVFPDDPFLCQKLIALYKVKERWAELVAVYESLVINNPGANEAYRRSLAECHLKAGQYQEAVAVIEEWLNEYGGDAADYRDAAQMLMSFEQYESAANICRKGIESKFGQSFELHCFFGRAMAKTGKYDEAIVAYKKAIELCTSPRDKGILQQELAELSREEPIIERILEERAESLQATDRRLAELYWQKALQEERDGRRDAAIALYRRIALLVPDSETGRAAEKKIQALGNP
jgi:tetratricopeptide (TPR) repeat protein